MSYPAKPWFDDLENCFNNDSSAQLQFYLACARFRRTYGYNPDNDSATVAQLAEFRDSISPILAELEERSLEYVEYETILASISASTGIQNNTIGASRDESGNGNVQETEFKTSSTTDDSGGVQESSEEAHSEASHDAHGTQKKSMNSNDGSKNSKHTSEEQLASENQSTPDSWSDVTQTTRKDETEVNKYLSKRLQHWKEMLATKKHSSLNDEDDQNLPMDMLDFNASMLSREDYDDLLASSSTKKQSVKPSSKSTLEKVSPSEQATAINALLYGLTVLKAATSIQQHEMVTSLLHPKVRKMQPSLAFEMNALLLELDTEKLLTMSVDEDALHTRAKKVARAWGIELSSLGGGPGGLAW